MFPLVGKELEDHNKHLKKLLVPASKWLVLKTRCCYEDPFEQVDLYKMLCFAVWVHSLSWGDHDVPVIAVK